MSFITHLTLFIDRKRQTHSWIQERFPIFGTITTALEIGSWKLRPRLWLWRPGGPERGAGVTIIIINIPSLVHDVADCSLERSQVASSICQKFHLHSRIDGNTTLINSIFPQRCTMIWFYLYNWWRHLKVAAFVKSPLDFMQKTRICKWGNFSFIVKSRKQIYEFVCIGSLFLLHSFSKSQCLAKARWSNSRFSWMLIRALL